ncbi:MAG: autotransporter domain-containing protein [Paracraurococcus sp.]
MRRHLLVTFALIGFCGAMPEAAAQTAANIAATNLLNGFSLLGGSNEGRKVLDQNLADAISINNTASGTVRAQAVVDNTTASLVGSLQNGLSVADGLGSRLFTTFATRNTVAQNFTATALSPNYQALFNQINTLTVGGDSAFAKNFFANGSTNGNPANVATGITLPAGGAFNVYDTAYHPLAANANTVGNSRPAQVAPSQIQTFTANDFFGVSTNTATGILPGLKSNASFPSGHAAFGFTSSILLAMMVPERFQQLVTRGAEFGNSRIVLGAHYPLDVIGARIHSTYALVQILNNNPDYLNKTVPGLLGGTITTTGDFTALYASATSDLRALLNTCAGGIAACATGAATDRFSSNATNKANYTAWLTYGLSPVGPTNLAPVVPVGAEVLIASRFPYLSAAQRRDVLATTELPSGQPLDDGTGYARLNLYAAADGYGALNGMVTVAMDAARGGFSAADSWNNDIRGTGGLTKTGTGILTLTGANTYAGPTIVSGGVLEVAGSITSATTVNAGGILAGAGTVGNVAVNGGGTLAPGALASIGRLTVNGTLNLAPGSTYAVRVTPGVSDSTRVSGTAVLGGGRLAVQAAPGAYPASTRVAVLSAAGGVSGSFGVATSSLAFLAPALSYGANDVFLTLNRNDTAYAAVGATANQRAVGAALDAAGPGITSAGGTALVNALNQTDVAGAQAALTALAGDGLSGAQTAALLAGELVSGALSDHGAGLRAADLLAPGATPGSPWRVWAGFFGRTGTTNGDASLGTASLAASNWGGLLGLDYVLSPNVTFGVIAGGSDGRFDAKSRATTGTLSGYHLGAYAEYRLPVGTYAHASAVLGGYANSTTRYAGGFGGLGVDRNTGRFDSNEVRGRLEIGHDLSLGPARITPFAAIELAELSTDGFQESGGGATALAVASRTTRSTPQFIGARAAGVVTLGNGWRVAPQASLAWVHDYNTSRDVTASLLSIPGAAHQVAGTRPATDAAQVKLGGEVAIRPGLSLFVDAAGVFAGTTSGYGGRGGLTYTW